MGEGAGAEPFLGHGKTVVAEPKPVCAYIWAQHRAWSQEGSCARSGVACGRKERRDRGRAMKGAYRVKGAATQPARRKEWQDGGTEATSVR